MTCLVFIICVLCGLNATAAGLHELYPEAPSAVLSVERLDGQWQVKFLDWQYRL